MFIVILKFGGNEALAAKLMEAHMACIKQGFDDGVFLVGGDIQPDLGGALIAHGVSRVELEKRISSDQFVVERVVDVEILEVNPRSMDKRLESILSGAVA